MARILACGAFLKNTACLLDTDSPGAPLWSAEHGDLSDPRACVALEDAARALVAQVGGQIDAVAHDLHPDFFSTHLAQRLAQEFRVEAMAVQHHHAHIAAVMAERGLTEPVLGIALDGVGLGSDGAVRGGELLHVTHTGFERVGHLLPLALAGGDVAAREPWRMAAAALHACGLTAQIVPRFGPVVGAQAARTIQTMLQRAINCPTSSAAGRWFDAAAGLLGLSVRQTFEAQAAIVLEQAASRWLQANPMEVRPADWCVTPEGQIDLCPLLISTLATVNLSDPDAVDEAAARFHLTLADALSNQSIRLAQELVLHDVVLGGGCFFNRILTQRLTTQLKSAGLKVWGARSISCGDAGLALGQAWVAAQPFKNRAGELPAPKEILCV